MLIVDMVNIKNQREVFNTIRALYLWIHPKQKCTNIYNNRINFYLDLEQNCFGGPEVAHLIKTIVNEYFEVCPKSARKNIAKAKTTEMFHVQGNNRPRWIQGPEWPMGQHSPMKFLSQEKAGNTVTYLFKDEDTNQTKNVKPFY